MTEELTNDLPQWGAPLGEPVEAEAQTEVAPDSASEPAQPPVSADPAPDPALPSQPADSPAEIAEASPKPAVAPPFRIAVSALSDIGCVRSNNEDFFGYDESLGIFVVCDGMGGMASGEVASSRTVAAIMQSYAASAASGLPSAAGCSMPSTPPISMFGRAGKSRRTRAWEPPWWRPRSMATELILGNVGDSRAYILQDDRCAQLTVDHSYINELIRNGTLTIENAHLADLRGMESVITRAVGVGTEVQPDFYSVDLKPGIGVLLATDGLTRYFAEDGIASILAASTFETACANLIHMAKQRGGVDNITCILLLALPA
jgi:serine/threonine protein phosphatase PrpC